MPDVQIDNIPTDVYEVLATRAQASGQPLDQYVLERLIKLAEPTLEEIVSSKLRSE